MSAQCTDRDCCPTDRHATPRTQGVWTTCDDCGANWWCVVGERDWMDEAVTHVCSGGCDDGYDDTWEDTWADSWDDDEPGRLVSAPTPQPKDTP